ncbi:MAG: phosphoenolpyruvate carboxykinase domain-containing protein, partial [Candidatus Bathyarchaeia archaeon]
ERKELVNDKRDKRVWIKWMELRIHGEVDALKSPTGLIPKYTDLRRLFHEIRGVEYRNEDYIKQFTIRVPENLAKINRVEKFYRENVQDTPPDLFKILEEQRNRLIKAQAELGDYISPEDLEAA